MNHTNGSNSLQANKINTKCFCLSAVTIHCTAQWRVSSRL